MLHAIYGMQLSYSLKFMSVVGGGRNRSHGMRGNMTNTELYSILLYSVKGHAIKILNFILKLSHCARTDYIVYQTSK